MYFLFLIAVISGGCEYVFFSKKLEMERRKVVSLSKNNEVLKKATKGMNSTNVKKIKFQKPNKNELKCRKHTIMYISPLKLDLALYKFLGEEMLESDCSVIVDNEVWYLVKYNINEENFIKGWINQQGII